VVCCDGGERTIYGILGFYFLFLFLGYLYYGIFGGNWWDKELVIFS
jgi:hypothetical protein